MHDFNPLYSVSGFLVGLLVGQTGIGGGALMTPMLILLFGVHPSTAVGTDLLYASATKAVGTLVHGANHTVAWRIVGRLALGSVPATIMTLLLLSRHELAGPGTARFVNTVLGLMLLFTAVALLARHRILALVGTWSRSRPARLVASLTILTGALLGVLVTVSSVGAGAIGVTVLLLLYPDLSMARIVGSDIAHAVPLTLVAGLGHWWGGT